MEYGFGPLPTMKGSVPKKTAKGGFGFGPGYGPGYWPKFGGPWYTPYKKKNKQ